MNLNAEKVAEYARTIIRELTPKLGEETLAEILEELAKDRETMRMLRRSQTKPKTRGRKKS